MATHRHLIADLHPALYVEAIVLRRHLIVQIRLVVKQRLQPPEMALARHGQHQRTLRRQSPRKLRRTDRSEYIRHHVGPPIGDGQAEKARYGELPLRQTLCRPAERVFRQVEARRLRLQPLGGHGPVYALRVIPLAAAHIKIYRPAFPAKLLQRGGGQRLPQRPVIIFRQKRRPRAHHLRAVPRRF